MPRNGWSQVRVLLLDIEGTTTPIDFVYKTLFPFADRNVGPFLREHWREPEIDALVRELETQHQRDVAAGLQPPAWRSDPREGRLDSSVEFARWLMAVDSKCTPLKTLQGKVWQQGFLNGELHGEVYPDVPCAFERWRRQQRDICIYSSGSVLAQQQLFRTVVSGDLTPHITGFFDTRTGSKTVVDSYGKIAASLRRVPREILFVSDTPKEIEAARTAEMSAVLCERSVAVSARQSSGSAIRTLDDIFPD